jgi:hypothetical protein
MAKQKLGDMIDEMHRLRSERKDLKSQDDALRTEYVETEKLVMEELQHTGLEGAKGDLASVSLSETEVPAVKDWNKLLRYITKNNALHLFERRLAKSPWVALVDERNGRPLPGVESFTKYGLHLSTR